MPNTIERSWSRFATCLMQNSESIHVSLDKPAQFQIVPSDFRQFEMTASCVAANGKWQIEAVILEQAPKLYGQAHPTRTVLLWAANASANPRGTRPTRGPLVTTCSRAEERIRTPIRLSLPQRS
jgi:hypothetical protein